MSEKKLDSMELIWEKLPKEEDRQHVRYQKGDLAYLYHYGFVDTERYTYKQWKQAFENFKQEDESYLLNKKQFLSLRPFRYINTFYEPFDPKKLRRGPWPDNELDFLYEKSIKPSSRIPKDVYLNSIKALKKSGNANEKGELIVDDTVITQLNYLIEKFPTPRRRLEQEVTRLRQEKDQVRQKHMKNRDASSFTVGESESEHQLDSLKDLESTSHTAQETLTQDDEPETIDIKSLKKPGGKLMG